MTEKISSIEYNEPVSFKVDEGFSQERVDKILSCVLEEYSRSFVQNLLTEGLVTCNGKNIAKNFRPKAGDEIEFTVPEPEHLKIEKENIPLDIMYEDDSLLVVNKPRGMVVHPAPGNYSGTLVNALLWHCGDSLSGINGIIRPGIVHRIDKDTSGLLLVAKTDRAHISLSGQIREHSLDREYRAVIHGRLRESKGTVDAPIGRSAADRKKMCVTEKNSKNAVTHYEVIEEFDGFSYIGCRLETGRTHQIRVHMAYLGHPVAGDTVYGPGGTPAISGGQCLHAAVLGFTHPVTGERIRIEAPLPDYFSNFLSSLRRQ
jgi:23S rRNA pseudouridine1911/1915/1917 synthase